MGGNQALHDTVDVLGAIHSLNLTSRDSLPSEQEIHAAVVQYKTKMIPRAFGGVKTSGGINESNVHTLLCYCFMMTGTELTLSNSIQVQLWSKGRS
jgi:hypothetical protein